MKRFVRMLRNRSRLLLSVPAVLALSALLLLGIDIGSAAANNGKNQPKNSHEAYKIRDPKVSPNLSSRQRAIAQRDAAIKQRQDLKATIQRAIEGNSQQGGSSK